MFWFEGRSLKLHHHVAFQARVIKQQVNKEFIPRHLQPVLAPHKGKASTQLQQETGDGTNQHILNLAFVGILAQAEKIKQVWIFQCLVRQIGVGHRQACLEICHGLTLAFPVAVFDAQAQRGARPAVLNSLFSVPGAVVSSATCVSRVTM